MNKNSAITTGIQLLKYGVIGMSNTLITLVVFYVLNTLIGLPYTPSNVIGYVLGVINSFIWNRTWVFKTHNSITREACLFLVGFLVCMSLQLSLSWLLLEGFDMKNLTIDWLPMKKPGQNIVMVVTMVFYTLCNYIFNRLVTFKEGQAEEQKDKER